MTSSTLIWSLPFLLMLMTAILLVPASANDLQKCGQNCARSSEMARCIRVACRRLAMGPVLRFGKRNMDLSEEGDNSFSLPRDHKAEKFLLNRLFNVHRPTVTRDHQIGATYIAKYPALGSGWDTLASEGNFQGLASGTATISDLQDIDFSQLSRQSRHQQRKTHLISLPFLLWQAQAMPLGRGNRLQLQQDRLRLLKSGTKEKPGASQNGGDDNEQDFPVDSESSEQSLLQPKSDEQNDYPTENSGKRDQLRDRFSSQFGRQSYPESSLYKDHKRLSSGVKRDDDSSHQQADLMRLLIRFG